MMANAATIERTTRAYQAEHDAWLRYETMANAETDRQQRYALRKMAAEERAHAGYWAVKLMQGGATVPTEQRSPRSRFLSWLAARWEAWRGE